jgi:hypothetical protein
MGKGIMRTAYLQGRASDEESELAFEESNDLREERVLVLDAMRLVDDNVVP